MTPPTPVARAALVAALAATWLGGCRDRPRSPTPAPAVATAASDAPLAPSAHASDATAAVDASAAPPGAGRPDGVVRFPIVLQVGAGDGADVAQPIDRPTAPPDASTPSGPGDVAPTAVAPGAGDPPGAPCAGILGRDGTRFVLDGQPVALFGVNATMLLDPEVEEDQIEPLLAALAEREVHTVRTWFFHDEDPDRFARLLDAGARHGVRFIVTLADNVFKGRDWFGSKDDERRYRPHLAATVARFKDRPEVLMWELINEPNCGERHDQECLDTIKGWLRARAAEVKAIDACHLVSTGTIGAGNYDEELTMYRRVHREPVIDVISAHRRSTDRSEKERAVADELDKPLLFGEIYDAAYTDGCDPQSDDAVARRAERIADDLRDTLGAGAGGYLLWDLAPGRLRRSNGDTRDYCNKFGFQLDDPLWARLAADPALPPAVPWQAAP